jgi:threonylcarbamoyladenosine tRNA methylthiotransferase MtaB
VARRVGAGPPPATGSASRPIRAGKEVFRTRAMVKVQDGCDACCAYCIVPHARGGPRSRPFDDVLAEARGLAGADVAEIVVTGVNVGRYTDDGRDLADLLAALGRTGPRIRLSSVEPMDLTARLLGTMAGLLGEGRFCPHLHVPLQTGSDRLLAAMGRGYDAGGYADAIAAARAALGKVAVTTDVIAGMPGESEADAQATEDLVTSLELQRLHVFRYSARKGTPAACMADQVPPPVRTERAARLRTLSVALLDRYVGSRLGGRADLVMETRDTGTSEDHLRVRVRAASGPSCGRKARAGEIVSVVLDGVDGQSALGTAVD